MLCETVANVVAASSSGWPSTRPAPVAVACGQDWQTFFWLWSMPLIGIIGIGPLPGHSTTVSRPSLNDGMNPAGVTSRIASTSASIIAHTARNWVGAARIGSIDAR